MTITVQKSSDGKNITIKIGNKFNYSSHTDFRASYSGEKDMEISYIVDMQDTDYMDSSALGMLLLLREHVANDQNRVSIINCNTEISNILEISNFNMLFDIK